MKTFPLKAHLIEIDAQNAGREPKSPEKRHPEFCTLGARSAKFIDASTQGFAEGVAQTKAEYEALLAQQIEDFKDRLSHERQRWAADEGEKFAQSLQNGLRQIHDGVGETAARVIAPFMTQALENRTAADLAVALEVALTRGGVDIQIKGPPDLLRAMQGNFQTDKPRVTFTPADTCDLEIKIDDSIIETCIGRWIEQIRESVA